MKSILKSLFISLFPVFALITGIGSIIHAWQSSTISYLYIGRSITALCITIFFTGLFLFQRARTDKYLRSYSLIILLGLMISLVGNFSAKKWPLELIIEGLLIAGWILYLFWYSTFSHRNTSILKVGSSLPYFELEDSAKQIVASNSFNGNYILYIFYRGNWCPLCRAQIKEVVQQYQKLQEREIQTVLISPQPHRYSQNLAEKFNVNFHFLTDAHNVVAKQLGILSKNGIPAGFQVLGYDSDTVMPTVLITDSNGTIVFCDLTENYRVRPEPENFIKIIDDLRDK